MKTVILLAALLLVQFGTANAGLEHYNEGAWCAVKHFRDAPIGTPKPECPYEVGTEAAEDWMRGFSDVARGDY